MAELQDSLPPGWESKYDQRTGKTYYINHITKSTTWDDPRRFQIRHHHGTSGSSAHTEYIPLQDMRGSPLSFRTAKVQDSSFTNVPDVEESVTKISSLFPTVSDTHIKLLLKKYHNREAVVISALQVEKYPIMTPGPFSTPPPSRNSPPPALRNSPVSRCNGSPRGYEGFRDSPKPHHSPKLKLRYMKSIFPAAEETIILDILSGNENNIQKTSEKLKELGFARKETIIIRQTLAETKAAENSMREEAEAKLQSPVLAAVVIKSIKEKEEMKVRLQEAYKDVQEHVLSMALDSVQFDEVRAKHILDIMVEEDTRRKEITENQNENDEENASEDQSLLTVPNTVTTSQSRQSLKSLLKEKPDNVKVSFSRVIEENMNGDYKSVNLSSTYGSNPEYARGANEKLLLEDYVNWQGPNPNFYSGSTNTRAKGPNKDLLSGKKYMARGSNGDLAKGAKPGLAKGSIFCHLRCSGLVNESRGK